MQHTLTELERDPDSTTVLPQYALKRPQSGARPRYQRLPFSILKGILLFILTSVIFDNGVQIIHQHAYALGFFALNFNVPLPFLLIGLWGIAVLVLAIGTLVTWSKIYHQLVQLRHPRPAVSQR